jgi:hypothetical protein
MQIIYGERYPLKWSGEMTKIKISTTINLGNYENLKIDVERNVKTLADYIKLRDELYDTLTDFATNATAVTQDLIVKYRDRVGIVPTTRSGWKL